MTVWVVQNQQQMNRVTGELESKFDLSPAEEFGSLQFLLSPTARPFAPASLIAELHTKLRFWRPGDHLLLLGNPILIGLAVSIADDYARGQLSLLHWDGRCRTYRPIAVDLRPVPQRSPAF